MHIIYITNSSRKAKILHELVSTENVEKFSRFQTIEDTIKATKYIKADIEFIDIDCSNADTETYNLLKKYQPNTILSLIADTQNSKLISAKNFHYVTVNPNKEIIQSLIAEYQKTTKAKQNIYIQTMPGFKVLINGQEIAFSGEKPKEMLALFVDNNGNPMNIQQITRALWPNQKENPALIRNTYLRLKKNLEKYGIAKLLKRDGELRYCDKFMYKSDISDILDNMNGLEKFQGRYLEEYSAWSSQTKQLLKKLSERL